MVCALKALEGYKEDGGTVAEITAGNQEDKTATTWQGYSGFTQHKGKESLFTEVEDRRGPVSDRPCTPEGAGGDG